MAAAAGLNKDGASSISVTVRVRPFTIQEAAQLTKTDDGPLFLGDGSLAAVAKPKFGQKGLRPVIKVVDDKCLYVRYQMRIAFKPVY
jgi:kinesin family protein 18/19